MMELISTKLVAGVVAVAMAWMGSASEGNYKQIARAGCQDKCGGVKIPFPFGIGEGCFLIPDQKKIPRYTYKIVCDKGTNRPRALILGNKEVLDISLQKQSIRVSSRAIAYYNCSNDKDPVPNINYTIGDGEAWVPIRLSSSRNMFVAIGCYITALLKDKSGEQGYDFARCAPFCTQVPKINDEVCDPLQGCCEAHIFTDMSHPFIDIAVSDSGTDKCSYAFLGEVGSYTNWTNISATSVHGFQVSLVYDWFLHLYLGDSCSAAMAKENQQLKQMCGSNSILECASFTDCYDLDDSSFTCRCLEGYMGNPYLPSGCQDINECRDGGLNKCEKKDYCVNRKGGYECICPTGYLGNATIVSPCIPLPTHGSGKLIIGFGIGTSTMISFMIFYGMLKLIKRRYQMKERENNFIRNGGLLLQQDMTTNEGVIDKTKIFTRNELVKATNNFNDNRVLGRGGQGTVYKGMLEDGTIVAVKKSKKVDEDQLAQFINEVVILSQINHRNIVRLYGCCLETDVPLLVYEFVHNGTLYQHIHHPTEDFEMTWEIRLQIAVECAGAIAYLHSSCSSPIYHRDIKSSNILLDEKYRAKISDFGTSRSISIDKTHVTTCVQGTFGYLDPEFFRSSQFSAKSDVYSFGVVLLELLTSKKSIFTSTLGEPRGLANEFTQIMETSPDQFHGILDNQVVQHCSEDDIETLAKLIERCLSMNLNQRPTMREVAMTLEMIKSQHDKEGNLANQQEIRRQEEQIGEDDSDSTIEAIYVNIYADDSSYSMDLQP